MSNEERRRKELVRLLGEIEQRAAALRCDLETPGVYLVNLETKFNALVDVFSVARTEFFHFRMLKRQPR